MLIIEKNKKAEWEGLRCCQGHIPGNQIFPSCFFITENLPILLFNSPICFLMLSRFPVLLFYLPILLFFVSHLLLYSSHSAFLFLANSLVISCFRVGYILILSFMLIMKNSLPAFMWGGYPEPGGDSRPVRCGEEEREEVRGPNQPERRLSSRRKNAGVHQNMGGRRGRKRIR